MIRLLALLALLLSCPPALAAPWLNAGTDVAPDPAWRTGTLDNGLRYAVRRNALPAGSVSVRLRIDAGALMERPDEAGYAHFIEHMLFRGTAAVPDGEGIRIWQRLGASFGSDTNAFTTASQTFYALDLPVADPTSLDTALATLSGMVREATIDPRLVEIERKVVLAERDLRLPPLARRIQDASRPLFYTGLAFRNVELAGTPETLAAATAPRLRAFYDRWYRPERATLILVGDVDPALLERLAQAHFGGWRGRGPAGVEPDYGTPAAPPVTSAMVVDPQASNTMTMLWPRPHDPRAWTTERIRAEWTRAIAARILNRRLTRAARDDAPFTAANVAVGDARRMMDQTSIATAHRQSLWRQSIDRQFAILAGGVATLPTIAEIAREVAVIEDGLAAAVAGQSTARSPALAAGLLGAVDADRPAAGPATDAALFAATKPLLTPQTVGAALRALTVGEPRVLMTSPVEVPGGQAALVTALAAARMVKAEAARAVKAVSFRDLGGPATPGRIVSRTTIADLGIIRARFANGVELVLKTGDFEKDRVLVTVQVGSGLGGLSTAVPPPLWTGGAIMQGGAGPLDIDAVERLLAGRRIALGYATDERSFDWAGATNAADLADTLRLAAAAIAEPRFDPGAFSRLKATVAGTYDSLYATPGGVLGAFGPSILHGGDARWGMPSKADIQAFRYEDYRAFWAPLFATGPRRVVIVGDVDAEAAIRAVAATIGAAANRPLPPADPTTRAVRPPVPGAPPLPAHRGDPQQGVVSLIWGTRGALADVAETRALILGAAILQTRLYDRFREAEGGTYAPSASATASQVFPDYGLFSVSAQLDPARRTDFERAVREVTADLARRGPDADELARAIAPIAAGNARALRTGGFWANALERDLDDSRVLGQLRTNVTGYRALRPADVRRALRRWVAGRPATILWAGPAGAGANRAADG